jgi:phospholipid/cholesterol/gamma-HCH transport system permease protein
MEVLTVNLVGRLTFRELGVLMTAIMVAGRSGSAFAAQIGTMKLNEEIDAMRTIGVQPMEALIMPRIIAAIVMMPLLAFYASILAIIGGGFLCAVSLDIPPVTFVQRLREVVPITDIWIGLIKAPVFGLIIGTDPAIFLILRAGTEACASAAPSPCGAHRQARARRPARRFRRRRRARACSR